MKATKVKDLPNSRSGAIQSLYRLSPPFDDSEYVVVSAAIDTYTGPETYIFESNENGEIIRWSELEGSFKGGLCHKTALQGMGYEAELEGEK